MTNYDALDYTAPIPGIVLAARGYTDVFRYLGDPAVWPKAMQQTEVDDLHNHGIKIHLNYEQAADFMLGGYNAGAYFGGIARSWATKWGFSVNEAIVYSADFDASSDQINTILDFLRGVQFQDKSKSVIGCYGKYNVVKAAMDAGYIGWQTDAWSNGQRDPRAIAWQGGGTVTLNGVQADLNVMNSNHVRGTVPNIPDSIEKRWPRLANEFPANAPYDLDTAAIWSDAGSRYAAERIDDVYNIVSGLHVPAPAGSTLTDADVERIAAAVVRKMSGDLAAG